VTAPALPAARTAARDRTAGRWPGAPDLGRVTVVVVLLGLALTGLITWAAARAHDSNEQRLLEEQAEEASAVLQQAVPAVTAKAQEAARIGALLRDDPEALAEELAVDVGGEGRFATIIVEEAAADRVLAAVGVESPMTAAQRREAADAASATPEVVHITGLLEGDAPRIAYSAAAPSDPGVVAHAERPLNPQRISPTREGAAFEGVEIALYLGDTEAREQLLLASTPDLPIDGRRTERTIPLGDTTMRFVVGPRGTLGGGLLAVFPWLTGVAGIASTIVGAVLVESLHRRRRDAEAFTAELHDLYRREHAIAHTLQHSLLPTHLDRLEGIEVAARYFAGAEGTEIGGDWYDVIKQDHGYTVVVGDVVGRGVQAAAVMAAMRYGTHAVAGQEADPAGILGAINRLEHIRGDFVTALCGTVDPAARTVSFASAGHPAPLLIGPDGARFLDVDPGPPIGFLPEVDYPCTTVEVPAGSVLLLCTDGLYERRGESIDVGLERLRRTAEGLSGGVEEILDGVAAAMLGEGVRDDTAMLAFRVD